MTPAAASIMTTAAVSAVVMFCFRRLLKGETAERYSAAVALTCGFVVGFFLIFKWSDAVASRHYHWTLHLAMAAAVLGPVVVARGISGWERWLSYALASSVAASVLTPTWSSLEPSRPVWIAMLTAYLTLLCGLLEPLAVRLSPSVVLFSATATAFTLAALITPIWSLIFGKLVGAAAFALLGVVLAARFSPGPLAVRGMALGYAFLVGGMAFVGCVEPRPTAWPLLAVPLAPLTLWLCVKGPLSGERARRILGRGLLLPAFYLAGMAIWIVLVFGAVGEEW